MKPLTGEVWKELEFYTIFAKKYLALLFKDKLLEEKDDQLNRLHNIQKELLTYKKRIAKEEIVYIVSSENYARQGIYKIGRTKKDMKFRSSSHNTTHVTGDKIKVIKEFKVNDSVLTEKNIHTKLGGQNPIFIYPAGANAHLPS